VTISGRTRIVGVWGHPVGHSRSPKMHNAALEALGLDWAYVAFDVAPEALPAAVAGIRALGLVGVNVTVPHKEAVPAFLDHVDEEARRIGSVNTIHNVDGVLYGSSTDGPGFLYALTEAGEPVENRAALILGAGGSARAVAFALAGRGGRVWIANRTPARAQALADRVNGFYPGAATATEWGGLGLGIEADLVVNTTSLGMEPNADTMPWVPAKLLRPGVCVYDLVYSPPETRLLAEARRAGCHVLNGLPMLAAQGAYSLSRWTGLPMDALPIETMRRAILL
jgi:shikimate dehydrogenase